MVTSESPVTRQNGRDAEDAAGNAEMHMTGMQSDLQNTIDLQDSASQNFWEMEERIEECLGLVGRMEEAW
jgi:hypothetical protein